MKALLALLVLLLVGCSPVDTADDYAPTSETGSATTSEAEATTEGGQGAADAEASANADTGVVGTEYTGAGADGQPGFTYTVHSITVDGQCAGDSQPKHGHFVVMDVTATNTAAGRLSGYQVTPAAYSSDGVMENDPWTFDAIMCAGDKGMPAEGVPTGKSIQFLAVADTQYASGVLVFAGREFAY